MACRSTNTKSNITGSTEGRCQNTDATPPSVYTHCLNSMAEGSTGVAEVMCAMEQNGTPVRDNG